MRRWLLLVGLLLPLSAAAQAPTPNPTPAWVATASGPGDAAVTGLTSAIAGSEQAVVVGHFEGSLTFGAAPPLVAPEGSSAVFVVRLQPDTPSGATPVWQRRIACAAGCAVGSPRVAAWGDYWSPIRFAVTGWAEGPLTLDGGAAPDVTLGYDGGADGFVALYDLDGMLLWALRLGGAGDARPANVSISPLNGVPFEVLVSGAFSDHVTWAAETGPAGTTSAGGTDGFVVGYGLDGEVRRAMRFGGTADDAAADAEDSFDLWVAATFRDSLVVGTDTLVSRGESDVVALRLSETFEIAQWVHAGGPADDTSVAVTRGSPRTVITGVFSDTLFVQNTGVSSRGGRDGFHLWLADDHWFPSHVLSGFGSASDDAIADASLFGDWFGDAGVGRVIATGTTSGHIQVGLWDGPVILPSRGGNDGFVHGTVHPGPGDESGTQVGGPRADAVRAVATTGFSGVVGGSFQETARLGTTTVIGHGAGDDDAFVAYYPPGTLTYFYVADEPGPETTHALTVAPNPARAGAMVRLTAPSPAAHASVRLYDALGRAVATLHDGPLTAGESTWRLPPSLPAGRYHVRATGAVEAVAPLTVVR